MNDIKGFTFYKSYYESLKNLKEKDKKDIINAMLEYVFEDKLPNFKGIKFTIWTLIQPNLNVSKNRSNPYSGAPYGNQNASKEKQSKNNQKTINDLKDKDKDKDKERDKDISPPTTHTQVFDFCSPLFEDCITSDLKESCENFFLYYDSNNWEGIKNWKSKARKWIKDDIKKGDIKRYDTSRRLE